MMSFKSLRQALLLSIATFGGAAAVNTAIQPAYAQEATRTYNIPAQDLNSALREFAVQTGRDVLYPPAIVAGKRSGSAQGQLTERQALEALLAGTGLRFERTASNGYAVQDPNSPTQLGTMDSVTSSDEEIVVTGSRISDSQPTAPVVRITQEDMRLAGQSALGDVVRALPQNFSGGQNPGLTRAGGSGNQNETGGSSLNLRGLGKDATLTLLNGTRLPYDGSGQATDVTVVPVAAIDRLEILLDGASAIYGSDAVGGVANIILRRDYDGAEVSARYGGATDGGYAHTQFTGLAGNTWEGGNLLVTAEVSQSDPIRARDRDYLSYFPNQDAMIYPDLSQRGVLVSAHQLLTSNVELGLDAFYTERETYALDQTTQRSTRDAETTIYGFTPSVSVELPHEWTLRLVGSITQDRTDVVQDFFNINTGAFIRRDAFSLHNDGASADVSADGPLFSLPAGLVRVAVGGGLREAEFESVTNAVITSVGTRESQFAFAEAAIPLVSPDMSIPGVDSLLINGALRYEDYGEDDFGSVLTPKFGVRYGIVPGLVLRASWGESFKTPTLLQQHLPPALYLYPASLFGTYPAGSGVLLTFGGNPDLEPERAETIAVGLIAEPDFIPGLRVELNWYSVDYTDRVVNPITPLGQAFTNPAFADFVTLAPSVSEQNALFSELGFPVGTFTGNFSGGPYNPANVIGIARSQNANAAVQQVEGLDLSVGFTTPAFDGSLSATATASWLDSTQQLTATSPSLPASGAIFYPADFRARAGLLWQRGGFTASTYVNYIDELDNTNVGSTTDVDAMTTVDLIFDYQSESGIGVNLAVSNVFDERPPFMPPSQIFSVNYDSTNHSAIGRDIAITLTKRF